MSDYKVLKQQKFTEGNYDLVPIRFEDRYDIMHWRNEQVYHLRQKGLLTRTDQDQYFENVVLKLFNQGKPNQVLFSFLNNGVCIGYGGLVHINWIDKHAEISFVINTKLEKQCFSEYWSIYLKLIEKVAFVELKFHKLFVYAFDLRPTLYKVLEKNNYYLDARLKEHCLFNNKFIDVIIYAKFINKKIS